MKPQSAAKVLILTADGQYLVRRGTKWALTDTRSDASVFEYSTQLARQVARLPAGLGGLFVLMPAESFNADEICDRCGRVVRPSMVFFDGRQFLCPECRMKCPETQGLVGRAARTAGHGRSCRKGRAISIAMGGGGWCCQLENKGGRAVKKARTAIDSGLPSRKSSGLR